MRYNILIFGLIILVGNSLSAQKNFSFLDCISTSISGGYNFGFIKHEAESVLIDNFDMGSQEESSLRVRNYPSYSIESIYYLKAYRNLRLGFGGEFTVREAYFEYVSTLKVAGLSLPLVITKHDRKFKVFGPSFRVAYAIPKWNLRIAYYTSYLFLKNRRPSEDLSTDYEYYSFIGDDVYVDGFRIKMVDLDETHPGAKFKHSVFSDGLEIHYKIGSKVYLSLRLRRYYNPFQVGIQHRRYEKVNGVEKEYEVGGVNVQGPFKHIGIGVGYHFFDKD